MTRVLPPDQQEPATFTVPVVRRRRLTEPGVEDPRIAERRAEVESAERRRRRFRLAVPVVVAVIGLVGVGALFSPLADVRSVEVSGLQRVTASEVLDAAAIGVGSPLVRLDEAGVTERVAALPWVAAAQVEARWPHEVLITVTERSVAANLRIAGEQAAVDRFGRVLGPLPEGMPAIPIEVVRGSMPEPGGVVEGDALAAVSVVDQFGGRLAPRVRAVRMDEGGQITIELTTGGEVAFGGPEGVPAKLLALESFISGAVDLSDLSILDVRESTHVVLTRTTSNVAMDPPAGASAPAAEEGGSGAPRPDNEIAPEEPTQQTSTTLPAPRPTTRPATRPTTTVPARAGARSTPTTTVAGTTPRSSTSSNATTAGTAAGSQRDTSGTSSSGVR